MKITHLETQRVKLPLEQPITTAIHAIESVGCVCVSLHTDAQVSGESYVFTLNANRLKAFDEMIQGLVPWLIGKNPHYVGQINQDLWTEFNPTGHKGVTMSALSAIDTACWDIVAKSVDKPLHHLFGACRDRIHTYASGGLWLSQSVDELLEQARTFIDEGFTAIKMRVGQPTLREDVDRVRAVRSAIGDDIELLVDANQALVPKQALTLSHALKEFNLGWFEEPVAYNNFDGQAFVREHSPIPIATGETEYSSFGMHDLLQAKTCDVLMPDLQRVGGLSEMLRTAALARAHHVPVSTHIFTEQSLCAAGAMSNCISVEHMPWFSPLFNEDLELDQGKLLIPQRPGTGFTFNTATLKQFKL